MGRERPLMAKVFISYRRTDSAQVTGRIYDHLVRFYGEKNVFKDVDSIPLGDDFRRSLETAVAECDVLCACGGTSRQNAPTYSC